MEQQIVIFRYKNTIPYKLVKEELGDLNKIQIFPQLGTNKIKVKGEKWWFTFEREENEGKLEVGDLIDEQMKVFREWDLPSE